MDARRELNNDALAIQRRFVARQEEQNHFRIAFRQILHGNPDSHLVTENLKLFLLNAQGGWGKSTLLNRFIRICAEEDPSFDALVIKIDWELYKVDKELDEVDKAITVMDILHDALTPEYESYFKEFRDKRKRHSEIIKERIEASKEFESMVDLTSDIVALVSPVGGSLVKPAFKTIARTAVPIIAEQRRKFSEWFRRRLNPDDYDLFDDPRGQLSRYFVNAFLKITGDRPLILMLDTAEHLLHVKWIHSGFIKYALPTSDRLLVIIAGRIPEEVRSSIRDNIRDEYIYKSDLENFSRLDIEDYLRLCNEDSNQEIPPSIINFIYEKTKGIPLAVDVIGNALSKGYNLPQIFGDKPEKSGYRFR